MKLHLNYVLDHIHLDFFLYVNKCLINIKISKHVFLVDFKMNIDFGLLKAFIL